VPSEGGVRECEGTYIAFRRRKPRTLSAICNLISAATLIRNVLDSMHDAQMLALGKQH